jgi:hypothetical protein
MTHLPNELLDCILLKLEYADITKVRQVCRRFQDMDEILNRKFHCLKTGAESHLAIVVQEENVLLGNLWRVGLGRTGRAENDSSVPKPPPQRDPLELFLFRQLLGPPPQWDQLRLLRPHRLLNII